MIIDIELDFSNNDENIILEFDECIEELLMLP